jgi:hypothetical protein
VASDATCIRSPNYPSNYNNNDACSITVAAHEQVTLSVTTWSLYSSICCDNVDNFATCCDHLTVAGVQYPWYRRPDGVQVAAGATISFTSDWLMTSSGFEVCGASPRAPTITSA